MADSHVSDRKLSIIPAAKEEAITAKYTSEEGDLPINAASGHQQELDRNFSLVDICGLGLTSGNTWLALGGSIVTAISNGGPPGVIYELCVSLTFLLIRED